MSDESEFNEEELHLGIKIFNVLYVLTIVLLFIAIGIAIYLGFRGSPWFIVIPIWAGCNFGLRVLKRYFRNILESLKADLPEAATFESTDQSGANLNKVKPVEKTKTLSPMLLVVIVMLIVSAMWYGIGALIRFLING